MKVLIILGKNSKGVKEAVEEDFSSWQEAIERSPVGEFAVIADSFVYLFFQKEKYSLSCQFQRRNKEVVCSLNCDGLKAKKVFDQLLAKYEG